MAQRKTKKSSPSSNDMMMTIITVCSIGFLLLVKLWTSL